MRPATTEPALVRGHRPLWSVITVGVVSMILAPIVLVGLGAFSPSVDAWSQLWNGPLPEMLWTTAILLILVGAGTIVLGTALAWLTTAYNFPGRRVFTWALMLPLAMPAYILGFVFLALFDFAGPVQTALRWAFGPGVWFPDVSSVGGVAIVMSLSLYPYVYILARSALREQTPATYEAARMLGDTRRAALLRVVLPMARPSLAAGAALVMMETLTDFATVQYFNVQTASVGVYQVWRGMFDRETAVELAALVLFIALVVMGIERVLRGPARFHQRGAPRDIERVDLSGWRRLFATGACGVVLGAAIVIPVAQLLYWLATSPAVVTDMSRALEFLSNSLALAVAAAAGAVFFAFVAAAGARFSGRSLVRRAAHLVTVGYAVPGPVVAIGVLVMIGWVTSATNPGGVVLVSLSGLVYAYIVRFMAMAYGSVDASLEKVTPSTVDAAHTLGASPSRVMRQIYFPMAGAGAAAGAVLVAIDVLKVLPIVLLIRPFGFTTASVWVWELASESRWASAAIPALLIVVTAVIPIALYLRRERRSRGSAVALETRLTTAGRI